VTNNCSFPATLNAFKTFYFAVFINLLTTSKTPGSQGYSPLMTSSLGNTGLNVLLAGFTPSAGPQPGDGIFSPLIYSAAIKTASDVPISGFHVVAYSCGSGVVDHIHVDVQEVPYDMQLSTGSCGLQTSGNLSLGSNQVSPFNALGFLGTFYGFVASTDSHTAAQVLANTLALQGEIAARGVPIVPLQKSSSAALFNVGGDSLTCGFLLATPCTTTTPSPNTWPQNLTLPNQPTYTKVVDSIVGISVIATDGSEANASVLPHGRMVD
jgi:hypothetical protein